MSSSDDSEAAGLTIGKLELRARVAAALGVSDREGARALQAVLDTLAAALVAGEQVSIPRFGAFRLVEQAGRSGTMQGHSYTTPPRRVAKWKAASDLAARIAGAAC